jgi:hypothetical protein
VQYSGWLKGVYVITTTARCKTLLLPSLRHMILTERHSPLKTNIAELQNERLNVIVKQRSALLRMAHSLNVLLNTVSRRGSRTNRPCNSHPNT